MKWNKENSFSFKYLKREKFHRLFLSKRFFILMLILYHIFWLKNGYFDFQYLKSKHKIYISSKNVLLSIYRSHLGK